jgi:photosystem II stability/assembly factor-like uncharacterized protein
VPKSNYILPLLILQLLIASHPLHSQFLDWKVLQFKTPLKSIHFVNSSTGYIYGGGIKWKTTDSGENWTISLNDPNYVGTISQNSVRFLSNDLGYATTGSGYVLRTTNGGENWTSSLTQNMYGKSLFFLNQDIGWLYGNWWNSSGPNIVSTVNGGNSWSYVPSPGIGTEVRGLFFTSPVRGYAIGSSRSTVAITSNGWNWEAENLPGADLNLEQIHFANQSDGWIRTDYDNIVLTNDGGQNWRLVNIPGLYSHHMFFIDSLHGWISSDIYFRMARTTDGGNNWAMMTSPDISANIYFKDKNTGWAVSYNGFINKTTDAGQTWKTNSDLTNQTLWSVAFADRLTGWVISDSTIWKSTNAGVNWAGRYSNSAITFNSLCSVNEGNIVAVGSYGSIVYTTTGGNVWSHIHEGTEKLNSVGFIGDNVGWAVGYNGTIIKTTNGGVNWHQQVSNVSYELTTVFPVSQTKCITAGSNSTILRTSDGGTNWIPDLISDLDHKKIYFIDENTGFVTSSKIFYVAYTYYYRMSIHKTTNFGTNWSKVYEVFFNSDPSPNSMLFLDSANGFIVGSSGLYCTSTNGGNNWVAIDPGVFPKVRLSSISNANGRGWIVGEKGLILTKDFNTVGVSNQGYYVADNFDLHQNFPNPFNPSTTISFSIPRKAHVRLSIYNLLGKRIALLINQVKDAGSHEHLLDATQYNLSSGSYLIVLECSGRLETTKMLFIK